VDGEAFLIGDAETVTWRDLYRPIAEGLGFEFDAVPSVEPPDPVPGWRQLYVDPFRTSELGQAISTRVPSWVKAGIRRPIRLARAVRRRTTQQAFSVSAPAGPAISEEILTLQRCRWRLPNDKAVRALGYAPPVSFGEACERSVAWLLDQFADDAQRAVRAG
jgi:nucleoside-diphosphate-sugar epimerase